MRTGNHNNHFPLNESLILTCLALALLTITSSSILMISAYLTGTSYLIESSPFALSLSIFLALLITYSIIMRLSPRFFFNRFVPQLRINPAWLFISLVTTVLFAFLALWLGALYSPSTEINSTFNVIYSGGKGAQILLFLSVILLAPIGEEYLFRGVLLSGLSQKLSENSAILLSSVVFMTFHLLEYYGYWIALVIIFLLGVLLATLRLRSQSMSIPIVCHATYNFVMLTLAF